MIAPELQTRLDLYLASWKESESASRVDAVEGFAINHGFGQYTGETIPEFLIATLNDLLLFLAVNPNLLEGVTENAPENPIDVFLREEGEKLNTAAELLKEMNGYWFGRFDPRYHRAAKYYHKVVKSLRLTDQYYS